MSELPKKQKPHPGNDPILDLIMSDLNRYGLISVAELRSVNLDNVITQLGFEFYAFLNQKA